MRATCLGWWLVVLVGIAACEQPQPTPLRMGVNAWLGYDSFVLAQERHLFDRDQLRVIELMSASDVQRALSDGLIDAAGLTLDEALRLADSGVDLKIVAVLDESTGGDAVVATPAIAKAGDLLGKRIALEPSASAGLMLDRVLTAGGLRRDDVTLVPAEPALHAGMTTRHQIDAAITYEPHKSRLLSAGLRPIFDSRHMPGEILDVLVVTRDAIRDRRPQVVQALVAWSRGRAELLRHPVEAARTLGPSVGLTADEYTSALAGLTLYDLAESVNRLKGSGLALTPGPRRVAEAMVRQGHLQRLPNWATVMDSSLAAQAAGLLEAAP